MNLAENVKNNIREALIAYCGNYPSQNRAAETLQGVSGAVVSQIVNNKYSTISDDMFMRISAQIGYSFDYWNINTESNNYKTVTVLLNDAQMYKNVYWITGAAGCGKTTAAMEYKRTHKNVYYISCSEDMRRSDFVREIAKVIGAPASNNLHDTLDSALSLVSYLQNPLLIFDEGDKLSDSILNYFISIYNRLEGRCGIVFLSTDYIERRMDSGRKYKKKGYEEIYSRIGRKFVTLDQTAQTDISSICRANGIYDEAMITRIVKESEAYENDLRRVKRVIHARKRSAEKKDTH